MAKEHIDLSEVDRANHSELVALCAALGDVHVSRADPPEELLQRILYRQPPKEDPLAHQREKSYSFVRSSQLLKTVLTCDAHCPTCPATQVVICWAQNKTHFDPQE